MHTDGQIGTGQRRVHEVLVLIQHVPRMLLKFFTFSVPPVISLLFLSSTEQKAPSALLASPALSALPDSLAPEESEVQLVTWVLEANRAPKDCEAQR